MTSSINISKKINGEAGPNIKVWFDPSEAELLAQWLTWSLHKIFDEEEREKIKAIQRGKKKLEQKSKQAN